MAEAELAEAELAVAEPENSPSGNWPIWSNTLLLLVLFVTMSEEDITGTVAKDIHPGLCLFM